MPISPLTTVALIFILYLATFPYVARAVAVTAQAQVEKERQYANAERRRSPFAVFGYLPEYRQRDFPYEDVFRSGAITHLIFFSVEIDPVTLRIVHFEDRLPRLTTDVTAGESESPWDAIRRHATAHDVRLMVCIGGGGRSHGFAPLMAADSAVRQRFNAQLNDLVLLYRLDGVDINWEYPSSDEQWKQLGRFMREMRTVVGYATLAVDHTSNDRHADRDYLYQRWQAQRATAESSESSLKQSRQSIRRYLLHPMSLTMAVHPHPVVATFLQRYSILQSLDFLHWMAYDHMPSPQEKHPAADATEQQMAERRHHSSVAYARSVLQDRYIGALDDAHYRYGSHLQSHTDRPPGALERVAGSIPLQDHRRKLTLGIPFYGRHGSQPQREPATYAHLQHLLQQGSAQRREEALQSSNTSSLRTVNQHGGYFFSSYDDVQAKMRLAQDTQIAGIMIWELGQDMLPPSAHSLSLLRAIQEYREVHQLGRPRGRRPPTCVAPPRGEEVGPIGEWESPSLDL